MTTHKNTPLVLWASLGLVAFLLLPWHALDGGLLAWRIPAEMVGGHDSSSGLWQVLLHDRPWLAWPAVALLLALASARAGASRRQGLWLMLAGLGGAVVLLAQGFLVGVADNQGTWDAVVRGQHGFGWGAAVTLVCLMVLGAFGIARSGGFRGDMFVAAAAVGCAGLMLLFIAFPVMRALAGAFLNEHGQVDLSLTYGRLASDRIWGLGCIASGSRCGVAWNTLFLALITGLSTTVLGTLLALIEDRGPQRLRPVLRVLAPLPIITPPFVVGLGLILLFGRAGLVNQGLEAAFGIEPGRWFYGLFGVWLAQTFAFTPIAFMIMRGVVQGVGPSLEEASQTLRADTSKTFWNVTMPLIKPGLANAFLVGFIESIADFGNPIIVGGQYSVLSTEIFFAIVGAQFDQGRAASLAWILTVFALGVFALQRGMLGRKNYTTVSGKGDAGVPMQLPAGVRRAALAIAVPWLLFTLVIYLFAFSGGFVQTWGRDASFTLVHFRNALGWEWAADGLQLTGAAWSSLFNTVTLAAAAAPLTTVVGMLMAWLLARTQFRGQGAFEFSALMAFAIPGTVLGVSYILAFNVPPFELTGTGLIIVLCFMFRNLPVGVRAGAAAFKQLDGALDEASVMLRAGTARTLWHVVLPLMRPAVTAALVYSFVRSMTTVSAVIFLVTAETELATTFVIGRVGQGDYGVALAYSTVLIVLLAAATALIQWLVGDRQIGRRKAGQAG